MGRRVRFVGCCHPAGPTDPNYNGFMLTRANMLSLRKSMIGQPVFEEHGDGQVKNQVGSIDAVWINDRNEYIVDGHVEVTGPDSDAVAQRLVRGVLKGLSLGMTHKTIKDAQTGSPLVVLDHIINEVSVVEQGDIPGTDIVTVASRFGLDPSVLRVSQAEAQLQNARRVGSPFDGWMYFTGEPHRTTATGRMQPPQPTTTEKAPAPPPAKEEPVAAPEEPAQKRQKTAPTPPDETRVNPTTATTPITLDNARYAQLLEFETEKKKLEEEKKAMAEELAVERKRTKEWSEAAAAEDPSVLKRKREDDRRLAIQTNVQQKLMPARNALEETLKQTLPPDVKNSVQSMFNFLNSGVTNAAYLQPDNMLERATQLADVVTAASSYSAKRATEAEALLKAARTERDQFRTQHESLQKQWDEYKAKTSISKSASRNRASAGIWQGIPKPPSVAETPKRSVPTAEPLGSTYAGVPSSVPMDTTYIPSWVRPVRPVQVPKMDWLQQTAQQIRSGTVPGLQRDQMLQVKDTEWGPDVPANPQGFWGV